MKRNSKQNEAKQTQLFLVWHDSEIQGDGRLVCQPFVLSVFFCYQTVTGNLPSRALNLSSGLDLAHFWLRSGIPEVSGWLGFIPLFQCCWSNRTNRLGCWVMWWVLPAGFKHTQKYVNKFTSLLNCCAGIFAMGEKKGEKRREKLVCAMKWVWTYLWQYGSLVHVTLSSGSPFRSSYLCYYLRKPYLNICMEMFVWNRSRPLASGLFPNLAGGESLFIYYMCRVQLTVGCNSFYQKLLFQWLLTFFGYYCSFSRLCGLNPVR